MASKRAGLWAFGLAAALPLGTAWADEANLGLSAPDAPPAIVVVEPAPAAQPELGAQPDLAAQPAVRAETSPVAEPAAPAPAPVVEAPAPAPSPDSTKPAVAEGAAAPSVPSTPDASPTLAQADPLAGPIESRLADPKLPLPPRVSKQAREDLAAYYREAGFKPLWIRDGAWNAAATSLAGRLARAAEDGLEPADYPVPSLKAGPVALTDADVAEAELKLSAAAYLYARDARGGRIEPSRISGLITPKLELPSVAQVLSGLAGSEDPDAALEAYNPRYPGYRALREKLAAIRANRPETPLARSSRSGLAVQAVADLGPEGRTAARLPAASGRLEGDLIANMERWRWLPSAVPARSINVNIPEFRVRVVEDGRVVHETRVITGRPQTPTPVFSGTMEYAIVNPSWFIPPSILKNEILPGLARDPNYAARRGYQVVRRGKAITVRQPPGAGNALGYIKFMFPNDHAVYLHDTPSRGLFGAGMRAFSHGCVRVENPFALGGQIMGGGWTEAKLKSLIGYGERYINLAEKLPVNLSYFTTTVDESGTVRTFDDVYGYHRRVRMALGLGA